jgi:hypothetical protein
MSHTVGIRDHYAIGHEGRMSTLAVSIAPRIGLPQVITHTIHMTGSVHHMSKTRLLRYCSIRHSGLDPEPRKYSMILEVACGSEDTGMRVLACPSGYQGIRRSEKKEQLGYSR